MYIAGCSCLTTALSLFILLQVASNPAHGSTITRRGGGWFQQNQLHAGARDRDTLVVDVSDRVAYSLNPSFKKPSYMRRISARRHSPVADVVLPCMASGIKPITYSWTLNGRPLSKKKRMKFNDDRSVGLLFFFFVTFRLVAVSEREKKYHRAGLGFSELR